MSTHSGWLKTTSSHDCHVDFLFESQVVFPDVLKETQKLKETHDFEALFSERLCDCVRIEAVFVLGREGATLSAFDCCNDDDIDDDD